MARNGSRSRSRDRLEKDKVKDRGRDRERDRDKYKSRDSRERSRSRDGKKERDRERENDRDRNRERDGDKERERERDRRDRDRERDRGIQKTKEKDKNGSNDEKRYDRTRDGRKEQETNGKRDRNEETYDRDNKRRRSNSPNRDNATKENNQSYGAKDSAKVISQETTDATSRNLKAPLTVNTNPIVNIFASNARAANNLKTKAVSFQLESKDLNGEDAQAEKVEDDEEVDFGDLDLLDAKKETEEEEAQRLAAERRLRLQQISSKYQQKDKDKVKDQQKDLSHPQPHSQSQPLAQSLPDDEVSTAALAPAAASPPPRPRPLPPPESAAAGSVGSVSCDTDGSLSEKTAATTATATASLGRASAALPSNISLENLSIFEDQAAANHYDSLILSIAKQQQQRDREQQDKENLLQPTSNTDGDEERRQLEAEKSALEAEEQQKNGGKKFVFDIFSASPSELEQQHLPHTAKTAGTGAGAGAAQGKGAPGLGLGLGLGRRASREALLEGESPHLQSNWDDGEGYYKARVGEIIGDRFQTLGVVGKGVFSTVLKCVDLRAERGKDGKAPPPGPGVGPGLGSGQEQQHVAIKMIRNNDTMRKAAEKEKSILLEIAEKDPENRKHCVRMITHFDYRSHVALVFEFYQMNLREALKKFGKDVGINIGAVRIYGRQLFYALRHLADLRVVHADIKLDNILCSGDLKQVKLCDFGSAFRETDSDNDPTPYLVSRFYRAPEIILGMPYDRAIDMWSVCLCLYELFTGHVMFPGRSNNEMLRLIMAIKGRFGHKQLKAHLRSYEALGIEAHFDPDFRFRHYEADPVTGKTILRLVDITNPTRDLATILRSAKAGADDMKLVNMLNDLLERGLHLDPAKRMTVLECMKHPFIAIK